MQRALAYGRTPSPWVPLRFLLCAPWFGAAAGALLAWQGEAALLSRWAPPTLALTHLITLGYLGMAMIGSMLQMVPVVADVSLPRRGMHGAVWALFATGALALPAAFLSGLSSLYAFAALTVVPALLANLFTLGAALCRPVAAGARAMVGGMRLALAGLATTLLLGLSLIAFLGGGVKLPALMITDLHAAWGLLGWVLMLVIGVAFQVVPMFQATANYPAAMARWTPPALFCALVLWSAFPSLAWLPALVCVAFAGTTLALLARRKRAADPTTLYWRLALVSLMAASLVSLTPFDRQPLLIGVLFLAGFAVSVVNGMLIKIVPFLCWYHLQLDGRVERGRMPGVKDLLPEARARGQFWLHCAAVAALLAAVALPQLATGAGAMFALSCAAMGACLIAPARRYRQLQSS